MNQTQKSAADAARACRFRLDVKRPGEPFVPHSFHGTYAAAFDAGLVATTGQCEVAPKLAPGWDFIVRGAS